MVILDHLEGGYHIDGIAQSMHHTLNALAGHSLQLYERPTGGSPSSGASVAGVVADVRNLHAQAWPVFKA